MKGHLRKQPFQNGPCSVSYSIVTDNICGKWSENCCLHPVWGVLQDMLGQLSAIFETKVSQSAIDWHYAHASASQLNQNEMYH